MRANPQWVPAYSDVDVLEQCWRAVETLRVIEQRLDRVRSVVNDTILYSGGVTYDGALAGYQNFKAAAKRNPVGAEIIVDDLAPRFAAQGRVKKPVLPQGTSDGRAKQAGAPSRRNDGRRRLAGYRARQHGAGRTPAGARNPKPVDAAPGLTGRRPQHGD